MKPAYWGQGWRHIFHRVKSSFSANSSIMATLESLNFDNLVLRALPVEEDTDNHRHMVHNACFSRVEPTPVKNPVLIAYSPAAVALLDVSDGECRRSDFANFFSGNALLPGSEPAAHCYCGHQFGSFSGQLGDGAAMYLGEIVNRKGERWELQLKGAGKTPYSRMADGRKVLRSSIREFLCSEAMHNLDIPTTRACTCVTSDSYVTRDIFYTGNNIQERCSIISRIAPTFIRFGSFEIFKPTDQETGRKGPSVGRTDILRTLTDYCIKTFYPHIWDSVADPDQRVLHFFREVTRRTATLVARWQCVGFCHGVLNTDNMSIVGATLDYGPFGFMDRFDPDLICNTSDEGGRYAYSQQPEICRWNCGKLAEALLPLGLSPKMAADALKEYDVEYEQEYSQILHRKFGLQANLPGDGEFFQSFLDTMHQTGADFTNSFRILSKFRSESDLAVVRDYILQQCCSVTEFKSAFTPQMDPAQLQMLLILQRSNPDLLAMLGKKAGALDRELALAAKSDELKNLTAEIKSENDEKQWTAWLGRYAARLKQENSDFVMSGDRVVLMDKTNPRIVLRNFIAQNAIDYAERGDFSEVRRVLKALQQPYNGALNYAELTGEEGSVTGQADQVPTANWTPTGPSCSKGPKGVRILYDAKPPEASSIRVSCSS